MRETVKKWLGWWIKRKKNADDPLNKGLVTTKALIVVVRRLKKFLDFVRSLNASFFCENEYNNRIIE